MHLLGTIIVPKKKHNLLKHNGCTKYLATRLLKTVCAIKFFGTIDQGSADLKWYIKWRLSPKSPYMKTKSDIRWTKI